MQRRPPLPTLLFLLVCTLLTSLLTFRAASLSVSHDPRANIQAQLLWHAESAESHQENAAHQHDGGSYEEAHKGHQHGHSDADHTHESLFVPLEHVLVNGTEKPGWLLQGPMTGQSALVTTLERPPKPTTA